MNQIIHPLQNEIDQLKYQLEEFKRECVNAVYMAQGRDNIITQQKAEIEKLRGENDELRESFSNDSQSSTLKINELESALKQCVEALGLVWNNGEFHFNNKSEHSKALKLIPEALTAAKKLLDPKGGEDDKLKSSTSFEGCSKVGGDQ